MRRALALSLLLLPAAGCRKPGAPAPSSSASASAEAPPPPPPHRCELAPGGTWVTLGRESSPSAEEDLLPFSVQVGSAAAHDGGFAVGALMPPAGGPAQTAIVKIDADTRTAKSIPLGAAHGDTEPPLVVSSSAGLFAAVLESSASKRSLRIARIDGEQITWGPSFEQGRDESMAIDLAIGDPRSAAVWDDDAKDPERGVIRIATFTTKELGAPTPTRTLTDKKTDAESPRLIARPGGFWLFYVARHPEQTDDDARYAAEEASFRWLEAVPLDANGAATAPARRLTGDKGHVLTFDVAPLDGDALAVVYRDDDTPSGASGGTVFRLVVRPDGSTPPEVVTDKHVGVGAPTLLPGGWVAVADAAGDTRIARFSVDGKIDALLPEAAVGVGMPLAAAGDRLLVSKPRGTSVRLVAVICSRALPADAVVDGGVSP